MGDNDDNPLVMHQRPATVAYTPLENLSVHLWLHSSRKPKPEIQLAWPTGALRRECDHNSVRSTGGQLGNYRAAQGMEEREESVSIAAEVL